TAPPESVPLAEPLKVTLPQELPAKVQMKVKLALGAMLLEAGEGPVMKEPENPLSMAHAWGLTVAPLLPLFCTARDRVASWPGETDDGATLIWALMPAPSPAARVAHPRAKNR